MGEASAEVEGEVGIPARENSSSMHSGRSETENQSRAGKTGARIQLVGTQTRPNAMTIEAAALSAGITIDGIRKRIQRGWTLHQAAGLTQRPQTRPGPKTAASKAPDYMRRQNASRRAIAIANGLCTQCVSDKARPNRTKCATCATIETARLKAA